MVEYTRDKILPEDLIQKTNLQQHNFMIDAINDIDERQADIEDVTNINIDDIAILKTNVVTLSNEKLDKVDIDADLHFGDISVTRDGTAVIMSLDVLNPTTGIVTPISFTIPGATSAEAGTMDASSMAWIAGAEERISALEGLSDVKAVVDLTGSPTQAQLTAGWVAVAGKQPETGDILQDINNSKLWVFVGTDWVLYGTIVTVPLATTSTNGGVRDTSLTAPGNRWYVHVEVDGRLSLIGGDTLTTLMDTTIPALQSGVNNSVNKTGNEEIAGVKTFKDGIYQKSTIDIGKAVYRTKPISRLYDVNNVVLSEEVIAKLIDKEVTRSIFLSNKDVNGEYFTTALCMFVYADKSYKEFIVTPDGIWVQYKHLNADGTGYSSTPMRDSPSSTDTVNKGYLDTRLSSKQDKLTFDSAPVAGSNNPVKSGGVYNALATKQGAFSLYEHTIRLTCTIGANFGLSLTVLNKSPTAYTLPTLRDYLGSGAGDYKQCSGMALWGSPSPSAIDLIGVRGGTETQLYFQGVNRENGYPYVNLFYDWAQVTVNLEDKVRQIV